MPGAAPASISARCRSIPTDMIGYMPPNLRLRPECDRSRHGRQLQPPVHHQHEPDRRHTRLHIRRRALGDPLARAERLRRLLHLRRRHDALRQPAAQPRCLPVRRPRRILVGGTARQCRGGARRGRQPRILERQRGLLESPLGNQHRRQRHAIPHDGLLQGDLGRHTRSERHWNRHLARPALCRSRTGAGKLADRHDVHRSTATAQDTITIPYDYSNLRFWRNTDVADLQPGQTAFAGPRTCSAMSGIPTSRTASGRPG